MFKLAIVGDLSQQDPARLATVLDAALGAADLVVQCGDVNPGYQAVKDRLGTGKLLPIPGNHDIQGPGNWDASLPGVPKQWRHDIPGAVLLGLNNSLDTIDDEAWNLLNGAAGTGEQLFIFCHKPLSTIVLPDGTESGHIMGEGQADCPDAKKLQAFCAAHRTIMGCGHYHAWAMMFTSYATVIVDGRGGAGSQLGYTLIYVQPEGMTAHRVDL